MSSQTFPILGDTVSNGTVKNAENLGYRRDVISSTPELAMRNDKVKALTSFSTRRKPIRSEILLSSTVYRRAFPQRLKNPVTLRRRLPDDELDI